MELRSRRRRMSECPTEQCPPALPEEQARPSCAPPKRKRRCPSLQGERCLCPPAVCGLCRQDNCDADMVGQLCQKGGLCVHENCLYHASGLMQRGANKEGFYGFLFPDIRQELKRVAQKVRPCPHVSPPCPHAPCLALHTPAATHPAPSAALAAGCKQPPSQIPHDTCHICQLPGASVTCRAGAAGPRRCRRIFHFPCGSKRGCVSQLFGEFKSFCWKHRPVQRVRAVQQDQTLCLICQEGVAERPCYDTLVCPACTSAWFHRSCIQGQALRSGLHHFCCPLCSSREQFLAEMFHLGIRIPDRDAAWEEEDGAFAGHYLRHSSCDANQCLCPEGREHVEVNGPWRLLLCTSCASQGTHQLCSALGEDDAVSWDCSDCRGMDTGEGCSGATESPVSPATTATQDVGTWTGL
ncbi:PHD finger protein 7-like [Tyto alba]|uniref:PHD finger protein 7-like n=1 Tax=Tyto alba TaxID=56313 RepID=UPI001C66F947|nr:PHD finger protein 7-like [Tyto alba]